MNSDTALDYALFQLSPRRTRCELFVSGDGGTEKLASGFLKPFVTHLRVAEEQASQAAQSIKLEVERRKNAAAWFNKGTLERFVRFVSTPEVLELVNTFDAEMSQLEGARKIYSQGIGDQPSGASSGENETAGAATADTTKKELLRAIDVRLVAVKQDLTMACARASAASFTLDNVSELLLFADRFGAQRLNEACTKFISLCQRRPELICHQPADLISPQLASSLPLPSQWMGFNDGNIRNSSGSDMSIDEPEVETSEPSKPLSSNINAPQLVHKLSNSQHIAQPLIERNVDKAIEEPAPIATSSEQAHQPGGGASRRLSVQDRINLFESKQKEQSVTANIISSSLGGGANRVAGKPEHRRLPSDISEKSVLRRWSGASDMSIDLNNSSSSWNDRKDSNSPAGTRSSSAHSQAQSGTTTEEEASRSKDTAVSCYQSTDNPTGTPSSPSSLSSAEAQVGTFSKGRDGAEDVFGEGSSASKMLSGPALEKDQRGSGTQFASSLGRVHQGGLDDQVAPETRPKTVNDSGEPAGLKNQELLRTQPIEVLDEQVGAKDHAILQVPYRVASAVVKQLEQKNQVSLQSQTRDVTGPDVVEVKDRQATKFRTFATKPGDAGAKSKGLLDSRLQFKASSGKMEDIPPKSDSLASQSKWRTFPGKEEEVGRKDAAGSQVSLGAFSVEAEENAQPQGMKLHRQASGSDQTRKLQGRGDKKVLNQGNDAAVFIATKAKKGVEIHHPPSTASTEHVQAVKPSKGNQDLNDELQMKANELEKLFAVHKLRVHGDQIASSRKNKPVDVEVDHTPTDVEKSLADPIPDQLPEIPVKESSSNEVEFDSKLLLNMVESRDYSSNTKHELGEFSLSDEFRGKFYEKYMQKRDAKLREESGSKRAQKEAKMKVMRDSLEHSQTEMKTKFAGSANRQYLSSARHPAEKLNSFNARSSIKSKGQTIEFLQGEEDGDIQELSEQVHYAQDKSYSDTLFGSEHSISIQSKKLSSSKFVSSSTPRTPVVPIPRPSMKATNSGSMKRRTQLENPLAQSVPNFSDFRKENTKPSTGLSKVTPRAQSKNFARSKSSNEEMNLVKEEKPRRSQSMRKSSANPGELKDLSPLNSDAVDLTPLKFSKEQADQSFSNKIQRSGELRPFLRKGNGIGPGAGVGRAKLKASMASEALKNDEEYEWLVDHQENSNDMVKDEEVDSERPSTGGNHRTMDFSVDSDSEKPRLSQESQNSGDPGLENCDVLRSLVQADDDLVAVSSKFDTSIRNVQESPGESPGSWNSHVHSFSYVQEASDIDVSVDSPTGSPASWNSHPLNQMMEADAAHMRKKWGSAQIPVLVANASHQSRKDVSKGFKRLLKFGRKNKGAEFLGNDWVSASTASEGDDDTEDGRDLAIHSSDDLRKSRMGYPIANSDGFIEGEVYPEQVQSLRSSIPNHPANFKLREDHLSGSSLKAPRSFFSLSSFRSKGSESKLR